MGKRPLGCLAIIFRRESLVKYLPDIMRFRAFPAASVRNGLKGDNTHRIAYRFATIRNDSLHMRKANYLPPRRIEIGGKPFWQVTVPAPEGGHIRKTFKDREEARVCHERAKVQLAQFGAAAIIDDRTPTDAARAAAVLAGTGKTLLDAARFLYDHVRRTEGGKPLGRSRGRFLQAKKAGGSPAATLPPSATTLTAS